MKLLKSQDEFDRERVAYNVVLPSPLPPEQVQAFLTALATSIHPQWLPFTGRQSIAIETLATEGGFSYRLLIPWQIAENVTSELRHLIPGTIIEESSDRTHPAWDDVVEIGLSDKERTINTGRSDVVATDILNALTHALKNGEKALLQWVIAPVGHETPPSKDASLTSSRHGIWSSVLNIEASREEVEDRRSKVAHPRYHVIGRIGARASTPARAKHIVNNILGALRTANGAARFTAHEGTIEYTRDILNKASTPLIFPATLNAAELTTVAGLPLGAPYVTGMPATRTRPIYVPGIVPKDGTILGNSTMPGTTRPIGMDVFSRLQHSRIIGPSGTGKTWLGVDMAVQDMIDGRSVVVIDPKGDLYTRVLERVPDHRVHDVIVWNLADRDHPIGFNVLRQGTHEGAIDELNLLISNLFPESLTVPQVMYHGLHSLAEAGTLVDLPSMIKPDDDERKWRDGVIKNVKDAQIRAYWETYKRDEAKSRTLSRSDIEAATLARRIWPFVSRPEIRNSLGQLESTFTMPDLVANSKILLVHLNGVRIGKQAAGLMGTLIMSALYRAVRTELHTQPVMLYMDEFQNFVTMPTDPGDMLAESRSFGLSMNLIHQNLDQLTDRSLRAAISSNCRTQISFQLSGDAQAMAREFGGKITPSDLEHLRRREAIAKVATPSGVSEPFTLMTRDAKPPTGNMDRVLHLSRTKYGRPVAEVEAEIAARRQAGPTSAPPAPTWRVDAGDMGTQ